MEKYVFPVAQRQKFVACGTRALLEHCWEDIQSHVKWNLALRTPCYSLSRKTVNTKENFWNVYCFATNQKRDETAKDNHQTAAWISHDLIRNNELAFSSTTNLQFHRFSNTVIVLFVFQLIYMQRIDMNDMFSDILRESDVEWSTG